MGAIDFNDPAQLRRWREQQFSMIEAAATRKSDAAAIETQLAVKREQLNVLRKEIDDLRGQEEITRHRSTKVCVARAQLRQHPPAWIRERLAQIEVAQSKLREQFGPQHRRESWLEDRIRQLTDADRKERRELGEALKAIHGELAEFSRRRDELSAECDHLLRRCTREAWPEPEADVEAVETGGLGGRARRPASRVRQGVSD